MLVSNRTIDKSSDVSKGDGGGGGAQRNVRLTFLSRGTNRYERLPLEFRWFEIKRLNPIKPGLFWLVNNFFVIGRIMMKLGKLVKCFKFYLMMEFWWVNWL